MLLDVEVLKPELSISQMLHIEGLNLGRQLRGLIFGEEEQEVKHTEFAG